MDAGTVFDILVGVVVWGAIIGSGMLFWRWATGSKKSKSHHFTINQAAPAAAAAPQQQAPLHQASASGQSLGGEGDLSSGESSSEMIGCPNCSAEGLVSCEDDVFEIRGIMPRGFPEGAVRKCLPCGSGIRVFSDSLGGNLQCELINPDLWRSMVSIWDKEFGAESADQVPPAAHLEDQQIDVDKSIEDAPEDIPDAFQSFVDYKQKKLRPSVEILRGHYPGLEEDHYKEMVEVREKTAAWLLETVGDKFHSSPKGIDTFVFGSINVNIVVSPAPFQGSGMEMMDRTNISIASIFLRKVPSSEKLVREVAMTPPPNGYGAVYLAEEDDQTVSMIYGTTLFARNLEREDFLAACQMIANISNRLAQSFQAEVGGEFFQIYRA